jgi:hypothetical protein
MFKFRQKVINKNFGAPEKIVNLKFPDIFYYAFFKFPSSLEMSKKLGVFVWGQTVVFFVHHKYAFKGGL